MSGAVESDRDRIDHGEARPETSEPSEVRPVEGQQVRHLVHVADGHQSSVR